MWSSAATGGLQQSSSDSPRSYPDCIVEPLVQQQRHNPRSAQICLATATASKRGHHQRASGTLQRRASPLRSSDGQAGGFAA
jgi:hypothetical protein